MEPRGIAWEAPEQLGGIFSQRFREVEKGIPEDQRISGGLECGTHPLPLLALDLSRPHLSVSDSFTVALPLWTPESRVAGLSRHCSPGP